MDDATMSALAGLIGKLSDGSSVNDWLKGFTAQLSQTIRTTLADGFARRLDHALIAQQANSVLDVAGTRLAAMMRTSMMDSFRTASLIQIAGNGDQLTDGWFWTCALDDGVCAACLELHGTWFPLREPFMQSHVNCRCGPVVSLAGVEQSFGQSGADFFAGLSPEKQDATLGKAGGAAYRAGTVQLSDFVSVQKSDVLGDRFVQNSLKGALANAGGDDGG